jgi:hypothetical protein
MSGREPINLAQLRRRTEADQRNYSPDETAAITVGTLLALIDAVEAAQAIQDHAQIAAMPLGLPDSTYADLVNRLWEALERFHTT